MKESNLGIIYVHQQKLTIRECIKKVKLIAEAKTQKRNKKPNRFPIKIRKSILEN